MLKKNNGKFITTNVKTFSASHLLNIFNDKFTSNKERWLSSSLLDGNTLFIVSAEKVESFPDTRIHFLDFIRKNSEKIKLYKVIFDSSGRPLYEIYI